ncbi:hypothetical protein HID58_073928, partial [Brassica napus]
GSVPWTEFRVPSSGDLERSLIGDPRAPLRQDPVPLVLLAWVPLKLELILNPDERVPIGKDRDLLRLRGSSSMLVSIFEFQLVSSSDACKAFLGSSLPSAPEMRTESGLSPDSSSISSRVRSSRVRVAPTDSMDSFDSSLNLTAKVGNPEAIVTRRSSPVGGSQYPPIGPPSVIGAEEVVVWRKKYELPDNIVIRVPDPEDRVSDFGVDEIPVYEGYFASGFRDQVPSLVAKISETLEISPGQLNPPAWRTLIALQNLDLPRVDSSLGKDTIERVLKLPLERRQIPFLRSNAALKRCSIWGEMSGSKGDEALAEYKKALEVMSARKAAPKSSKRQAGAAAVPSSSQKKSKASGSSPKVLLASEEDSSMAIQSLQGDLLQVASQLHHLGERMEGATSTKVEMDTLAFQLREEKDASIVKDKEIKALRLKVSNQEEAGEMAAAENVSLRSQLKNREKELNELKDAAETFDAEKSMTVNGAKVEARLELMREWLSGQTDSWEPVNTLEQYKTVKITEAELLGLPPPSFEYEPRSPVAKK